ncbi:MAG: formylglycine-generating enzyme family protein [Alphaproteobacteria bacterium]|nr:formylglycine-generating enzyme family protein [Alphaproteobacteria bacterium]
MVLMVLWGCGSTAPTAQPASPGPARAGSFATPIDDVWMRVEGGTFSMGSSKMEPGRANQHPLHEVTVPTFAMMKREVINSEYKACVAAGKCPEWPEVCSKAPHPDPLPAPCLDFDRAEAVCHFLGGRLPTESEWEYVATTGGRPHPYPWGPEPHDCTRANVSQTKDTPNAPRIPSCRKAGLWPPCSHPAGSTPAGFCDMGGNVFEWTADWFQPTYEDHPRDGSAQTQKHPDWGDNRVMRGGGIGSKVDPDVRVRTFHEGHFQYAGMGARCAKDL